MSVAIVCDFVCVASISMISGMNCIHVQNSIRANCREIEDVELSVMKDGEMEILGNAPERSQFLKLLQKPSTFHDDAFFYIAGYICRKRFLEAVSSFHKFFFQIY